MEKIDNSEMIMKLVEMPSCTFNALTPEGLLSITVDKKTFDVIHKVSVEVTIKREDCSDFSRIFYSSKDYIRADLNESGLMLETISHKADDTYPLGYVQHYDHNKTNYHIPHAIKYEKDGKKYFVEDNGISTDNEKCIVRVDTRGYEVFVNKISPFIELGMNIANNKQILYIERVSDESERKQIEIPINDVLEIASMIWRYNGMLKIARSEAKKTIHVPYVGENGRQLLLVLPTNEAFPIPEDFNLNTSLTETKRLLELYKRDSKILYDYHNPETITAIMNATDEYTKQKEVEKNEEGIAILQKALPSKKEK